MGAEGIMTNSLYPAKFWKQDGDETIKCLLCPRQCVLREGQHGFCFVRANHKGYMVLTTYGRPCGMAIDPIEKKPLNHFFPGSKVLSFGSIGCNMDCSFCQNYSLSRSKELDISQEEVTPENIVHTALKCKCTSIAFTYNEPIISAEYVIKTAKVAHSSGLKTVAVTNGYIEDSPRKEFFKDIDAANIDLKGFSNSFYKKYTSSFLNPVLETLIYLRKETNVWLEVTNLIIPGLNDNLEELKRMCNWIVDNLGPNVPLHFSAFHPSFRMTDIPSTPLNIIKRAYEIAISEGVNYVYTGNIYYKKGEITLCPVCKTELIVRQGYEIEIMKLETNSCSKCGYLIAGFF